MPKKAIERAVSRMKTLDVTYLRSLLDYDPKTGEFSWRVFRPGTPVGTRAGCQTDRGYVYIGIDASLYLAHRLAWAHYYGTWPTAGIDHRDRDPSNNRIANLRVATYSRNGANLLTSRGGLKGAFRYGKHGRWFARIMVHKVPIYLGSYDTAEEAHDAYCRAAVKHFGEFARFE